MGVTGFEITVLSRALLAAVLGFVIGWERESSGAAAGDRTFALVAAAAATLTAFSMQVFPSGADRIIAGIVTGVGFLGAGMIMRGTSGEIRGLTTAAGLWAAISIGVVAGAGYIWLSVFLTILVLLVLVWEELPLVRRLGLRNTRSHNTDERTRLRDGDESGATLSR